jgi:hypothetical protein
MGPSHEANKQAGASTMKRHHHNGKSVGWVEPVCSARFGEA